MSEDVNVDDRDEPFVKVVSLVQQDGVNSMSDYSNFCPKLIPCLYLEPNLDGA